MSILDFIPATIVSSIAVFQLYLSKRIEKKIDKTNALEISYLEEKGKNTATREDINEITKAVEEIKKKLDYETELKLKYSSDKYNYLTDYYNSYFELIYTCMIINIWRYDSEEDVNKHIFNIEDLFTKFNIKFNNLLLYFESEELENSFEDIFKLLEELTEYVINKHYDFLKLVENNNTHQSIKQDALKYIGEFRNDLIEKYNDRVSDSVDSLRTVVKNHLP